MAGRPAPLPWAATGNRALSLIRVNQPPGPQCREDRIQTRIRHRKATFAAPEHSKVRDDLIAHVPRTVHDDGSRRRFIVGWIETLEAHRAAMLACIQSICPIRTR